jgi:hypothetical protein
MHSQHGAHSGPAHHFYLDDPDTREDYFRMVEEIVTKYKDDPRICIWDIYNEPGNSRRAQITMPNVKALFQLVRSINPSQPLTAGVFNMRGDESIPLSKPEQYVLDNSDIISYPSYKPYDEHIKQIRRLKKEGRPIICTEWLGRCLHNDVFTLFPLFYLEKIGCYNWGFVAGKYQTYEPWEKTWLDYENGVNTDVDFRLWFHDLYRPNHRPYDPREIDLIQKICALAEADF